MGSRHKGAGTRDRIARQARAGPHWVGIELKVHNNSFEKGETVIIRKNKARAVVEEKTSLGYKLEGKKGYFPPETLEKIK